MDANEERVQEILAERAGKKPSAKKRQVAPKEPIAIAEKRKPGRPTKYSPEMDETVASAAVDGATLDAIAAVCEVSVATVKNWLDPDSPLFREAFLAAVNRARERANNLVLTSLFRRATGYDYTEQTATPSGRVVDVRKALHPETAAAKSWLANRIGWVSDSSHVELTGANGGPIETRELQSKTTEELVAEWQELKALEEADVIDGECEEAEG